MGRGRARGRPPTPSDSSSSEEELLLPVGVEEDEDEADDESGDDDEFVLLPVGAEVEVRSDDPGFAGSFYEATVAGHLLTAGRRGRYTVAYTTLLADDGDDEPLTETAAAGNVRPRPPPPEAGREFAVHEMVEAFHNDGWWAGVVSAVLPRPVIDRDRRQPRAYVVTFPTSRETLEFGEADLRPHRVFEGGRWVPAAEVDNGSPLFGEGNQVEVSGKSFGAFWSPATVLKVIGATNFLVEYMHIENDGELATGIVDSQDIRPARAITRMDSKYRFSPSSHVEVHHEDSWWPGVIVKVLGSGINKKYVVKLKNYETDMEDVQPVDVLTVQNTQLRPRFDWDGKKWVRCVKEPSHQNYVHEMHPCQKSSRKRLVSALYDDSDKISNERDSHRDKKLKNEDVISGKKAPLSLSICNENNEITHNQRNAVLALRSELSLPSLPPMAALNQLSSSSLAPSCHLEQSSSQMIVIPSTPESWQLRALLFAAFGQPTADSQDRLLGSQEGSGVDDLHQGGYVGETSVEQDTGGELCQRFLVMADNANVPLLPSAESCEANLHDNRLSKDNTAAAVECVTCYAAPAEDLSLIPVATLHGVVPNLLPLEWDLEVNITEDMDEENHQGNVVGLASNGNQSQYTSVDCPFSATTLTALEDDMITTESPSRKFLGSSQSIEKSTITRLSSVGMSNYSVTEPFDDSLAITNGVEGTPVSRYVASRTSDSVLPLSPESVAVHESTMGSLAIHRLPFVKTSPMWAHLEALEIFRKAPQRPHFRHFEQYCPELREGMALGMMLSFANLAESINMLDVQGDKELLEQKMKSLTLLEENGFDVTYLRSCVETLIATYNSRVEDLEEKIARVETYDQELGTQVRALAMTVQRLELHAYLMRNMMRSAITRKMSNAVKISRLKAEANDLERSYLSNAAPR
ncbi:DUF724 domain-containing protein 7-like isoform X1 [Aegilops tauschii subsp. strangulata]|nr:DUF724 domain-containing protein 6-like isoform X1 [Aegilops tauschii subsp. strangulata]